MRKVSIVFLGITVMAVALFFLFKTPPESEPAKVVIYCYFPGPGQESIKTAPLEIGPESFWKGPDDPISVLIPENTVKIEGWGFSKTGKEINSLHWEYEGGYKNYCREELRGNRMVIDFCMGEGNNCEKEQIYLSVKFEVPDSELPLPEPHFEVLS